MDEHHREFVIRTLVRRRSQILAYLWSIVRDHHAAEDLFQEVSIIATQKSPDIRDEARLLGWLLKTARYEALNLARKRKGEKLIFREELLNTLDRQWASAATRSDENVSEALEECLDGLAPKSRKLIELRYGESVSGAELAARVGGSVNSVYVALSRIHRRLGECVSRVLRRERDYSHG